MIRRRILAATAAACLAIAAVAPAAHAAKPANPGKPATPGQPAAAAANRLQDLQVLSITDFHGALAPGGTVTIDGVRTPAGGVAYLATHLEALREGQQRSVTFSVGDNVGATPLVSAAFHDEPTIEALNLLGTDASTIGNHEFDEGYRELLRLVNGGCLDDGDGMDNQNSCPDGTYDGADFPFVAANVFYADTDESLLPAYTIVKEKGIKIGVIGAVLEQTPDIVTASGVAGLEFTDEVEAINKASAELTAQGINTQFVLVHQGASADPSDYRATCADGAIVSGPVVEIAEAIAPAVDLVMTGHVHSSWVCSIDDPAGQPRLVTEAMSAGRIITEHSLHYDPKSKDIVRETATATNHLVSRDVTPDATLQALVDRYAALVAPIADRVIGSLTGSATRTPAAGYADSNLGNLIADAQLADDTIIGMYEPPVIAFMNPGGIRADMDAGEVTYGEAFTVQPFNNYLVSLSLTGDQIYALLTEQVTGANAGSNKVLQVSEGFSYTLTRTGAVDGSVLLDGVAIDRNATYRVVTNNFLADGGDGFATFRLGTDRLIGGLDIDAFADYLIATSPTTPPSSGRIVDQRG